jgi:hypothetical protein
MTELVYNLEKKGLAPHVNRSDFHVLLNVFNFEHLTYQGDVQFHATQELINL